MNGVRGKRERKHAVDSHDVPRERNLPDFINGWPQVALSRRSRANGYKRQEKQRTVRGSNVIALVTGCSSVLSHYYSCYDTKR